MKKILLVLLPLLFSLTAWSQETQVTGRVISAEDNLPIPGVNIVVEGTTRGTTTDVDGNLDPNQFTIIIQPLSGAKATIAVISSTEVQLILDYTGITFKGPDELTIRACDVAGACTESLLSVEVDVVSSITVYNAIAPNSTGDNKFMRITGLPEKNKVSIFNRWGDKVYEVENYQSQAGGNAFRGFNTDGKNLPSGTYFYKIEVPEKPMVTGYLTLKQ